MTFIIIEKRKVMTKMQAIHTVIKMLIRLTGSDDMSSRTSNAKAPMLLNHSTKRAIIFFIASWTSSILLACWALTVMYVRKEANADEITNITIVVAQLVSLLLNTILQSFIYVDNSLINGTITEKQVLV